MTDRTTQALLFAILLAVVWNSIVASRAASNNDFAESENGPYVDSGGR